MNLEILETKVEIFRSSWFPESGANQPFWFKARSAHFYSTIHDLCSQLMECVDTVLLQPDAKEFLNFLKEARWSSQNILYLAVMLDQMPRNALATNFGRFSSCDNRDTQTLIDDKFSYTFACEILRLQMHAAITDERLICFFSLVFRHSNNLERAEEVLLRLSADASPERLPILGMKFWEETQKRRKLLQISP